MVKPAGSFGLSSPQPCLPKHLCSGKVAAEKVFRAYSEVHTLDLLFVELCELLNKLFDKTDIVFYHKEK
jgi:hypothetical protein